MSTFKKHAKEVQSFPSPSLISPTWLGWLTAHTYCSKNEKKSSSYKDNSFDFLSDEKSKIKKFVRISTRSYRLENGRRDPPELYSRSRRDTSTPTQTR